MKWTDYYRPARAVCLRKLLPLLVMLYTGWFLAVYLPAKHQARVLDNTDFLLAGSVLSATNTHWGCRAVIRQANGVCLQLTCDRALDPGCRLQVMVRGSRPEGQRNPGGFDESAWLASQRIFLKAKQLPDHPVEITRPASLLSPARWAARSRRWLEAGLARLLPSGSAVLLAALLLGDTSGLTGADRLDFVQSGLAHLTAVSGLHLSCLLLPLSRLLHKTPLRSPVRYRILLMFLFCFGIVTGWRISVIRASVMTAAGLIGKGLLRQTSSLYALFVAVLVLLAANPLTILGSGFWMSVSATAAVLQVSGPLAERLQNRMPRLPAGLLRAAAVVVSAQLATAPWSLMNGTSFSLAGLAVNLPAGSLTGLILWLGLLLLPIGLLAAWLPLPAAWLSLLAWPLDRSLVLLREMARWTARIRWGRLYTAWLNPFWLAAILLLAVWCLDRLGVFQGLRRWTGHLPRLLAGLFLAGAVCRVVLVCCEPPVQVWFFDVGQGDAILIRARGGSTVLVDGGKTGQGLAVLIPALDALGISRIDLVVATHAHVDHIGGLVELADYRRIRQLVLPGCLLKPLHDDAISKDPESAGLADLLQMAHGVGIEVQSVAAHDTIALGRWIRLSVLDPPDDPETVCKAAADGNAGSLILLADLAGHSLLLTADCTAEAEKRLAEQQAWPDAAVLKVAHHGSASTTGPAMLQQVQPQLAIILVGSNRYGHPSDRVLERLAEADCPVFRTDESGAIRIGFARDCLTLKVWVRR